MTWFSPLGWVNTQIDPNEELIVNFGSLHYFNKGYQDDPYYDPYT